MSFTFVSFTPKKLFSLSVKLVSHIDFVEVSEKLFIVPNTSFIPMPNVDSEVIKLKIRKEKIYNIKDEEKLFRIIKFAFMQRRKTLINALQNIEEFKGKDSIKEILKTLNLDEKVRGEALTLEDFINISNLI